MPRFLTASDRAILVEAADLGEAMRLHRAYREAVEVATAGALTAIGELVPAARTVLVRFDPHRTKAVEVRAALAAVDLVDAAAQPTGLVEIPVVYDGEDLREASELLGISGDELVERHLAANWQVAFSGFAPGFGYLVGDDPLFDVPRRATPRTRVPAGAVGLAGQFTGVYPRESPGGWQLIGRTDAVMWDATRTPPALLAPGTRVRFVSAERQPRSLSEDDGVARDETPVSDVDSERGAFRLASLAQRPGGGLASLAQRPGDTPHLEIVAAPLPVLVQDLGRPGLAHLGVSASGAADRTALRGANRAVGNAPDAAALELLAGGAIVRFTSSGVAAVAGAVGELVITSRSGTQRGVEHAAPFAVFDGDELMFAQPEQGLRYVLAVRGGIHTPQVLGSSATDTLAGLGPAPLRAGDVIDLGDSRTAPHLVDPHLPLPPPLPAPGDIVTLGIMLGPRDDWFTASALHTLTSQEWQVTPRSDRVGIRLAGARSLERAIHGELPSEGAVTGALQVPADGQPVLFLPDHPLTGGYPVIGALIDAHLDLAAQLPPGCRVRFAVV